MDLDPKQCAAVQAVIETGSFEKAARQLNLTASAVSQRVHALEATLGAPLVARTRPCRPTQAGRRLMQYLKRLRSLESELEADLRGSEEASEQVAIAVNADVLSSFLLPALAPLLEREKLLLELIVDDQDHTYGLLEAGLALGCVSAQARPMRGCVAESLGIMRYRCLSTPGFREHWFSKGMTRSACRLAPVVMFNRKDRLPSMFLQKYFGLADGTYPSHYVPSSDSYLQAIRLGLGWGMVPEAQLNATNGWEGMTDLAPQRPFDVPLFWHCWKVQSARMSRLSGALVDASRAALRQSASTRT